MENNFTKVLVCCPTAAVKNYCSEDWIDNVMNFKYPNFQIFMVDNTIDGGANAKYLNDMFNAKYGVKNKFLAIHSNTDAIPSVINRMAISHNLCSRYALQNNYTRILHLESDVFPPADIIESLMVHNKMVIGGLYFRDEGIRRKIMLQRYCFPSDSLFNIRAINFKPFEELGFIDGCVKQVASVGLGCVLIRSLVLKKIPFRFVPGESFHPDSYFSEDCFRAGIKIFADTSKICEHRNVKWGIYKVDFS